mmetsp:Transcript_11498/g.14396  ORF Transcript_11498/g.14396 Transcript_11498/m.14396 type:complete len:93 (-) Transcript_11498:29-307(-)
MSNLASMYCRQGKYDKAEKLYKKCFQLQKDTFGPTHPQTLTSMNNLALLYKKYNKSETLFKQCLQGRKEVLGEDHPDTMSTLRNLQNIQNNK